MSYRRRDEANGAVNKIYERLVSPFYTERQRDARNEIEDNRDHELLTPVTATTMRVAYRAYSNRVPPILF